MELVSDHMHVTSRASGPFPGLIRMFLLVSHTACNVVKLQLDRLGFDAEFLQCQIQTNDDKVWDGIRRKYWHNRDVYYLPKVTWNDEFLGRKNKAEKQDAASEMEVDQGQAKRQRCIDG